MSFSGNAIDFLCLAAGADLSVSSKERSAIHIAVWSAFENGNPFVTQTIIEIGSIKTNLDLVTYVRESVKNISADDARANKLGKPDYRINKAIAIASRMTREEFLFWFGTAFSVDVSDSTNDLLGSKLTLAEMKFLKTLHSKNEYYLDLEFKEFVDAAIKELRRWL